MRSSALLFWIIGQELIRVVNSCPLIATMGWTGFKYDVFISYARVDNQIAVGNSEEKGWVSLFHSHLKVALSREVGLLDVVTIWRDTREITGNQLFDSTIQDALDNSAVF